MTVAIVIVVGNSLVVAVLAVVLLYINSYDALVRRYEIGVLFRRLVPRLAVAIHICVLGRSVEY